LGLRQKQTSFKLLFIFINGQECLLNATPCISANKTIRITPMPSHSQIQQAATLIRNDGVICYPTESVFGLGCNPLSEIAVNKILTLKQRSVDKGLIIIAGRLEQLTPYLEITEKEIETILREKKATTWLVKKSTLTPNWVSGTHTKVAIRVSQHPTVIELCEKINQPLVSTSANPAGENPALSVQQSRQYFSDQVDLYLDGNSKLSGNPTQIIDIETDIIIR